MKEILLEEAKLEERPVRIAFNPELLEDAPVENAVFRLITHAAQIDASDLFLGMDSHDAGVMVRHQGIPKPLCRVSRDLAVRIVNHLKAMAGMPYAQKQWPADGRWLCPLFGGAKVDLRINTIPTLWGEDLAIRLLRCDTQLHSVDRLGYNARASTDLCDLLNNAGGLILVTGPTGSGKTTTLYACINYLCNGTRKINTIEDPVEYHLPGVRQSQVRPEIELDFPVLLRSVLRQAPDVIMIGEIRDPVTAETAVLAANSGHLVLATLHAPYAAGCINTMLALNVNARFLATSFLGAVSQRLVRKLCPHCKTPFRITDSPLTFEEVRRWLGPGEGDMIYSAPGCDKCLHEGYLGQTVIAEVLHVDSTIRQMIHDRSPSRDIHAKAVELGMPDLRRDALLKVAQGVTSTEELIRTIPGEHLVKDE